MHWDSIGRSVVTILSLCLFPPLAAARILLVDGGGGGDYLLVSEAMAAASGGDTVAIEPGTYDEYDGTGYHIQRDSTAINVISRGTPQDVRLRLSMEFADCSILLENLTFHDEHAPICVTGVSSTLIVRNCVFQDNTHFLYGAAVEFDGSSSQFEDCTFTHNTVNYPNGRGGALHLTGASCLLRRCVFIENSCTASGGGVYMSVNDESIEDCVFIGNVAYNGAALRGLVPAIHNCTFWRNHTTWDSGATVEMGGPGSTIQTSIIAGTVNGYGIGCWAPGDSYCCCYWENERGPWAGDCGVIAEYGNIEADPVFCDPRNDDVSLRDDSPCVPGEHGGWPCELIGAFGIGCGDTPTERTTWGRIKRRFIQESREK
jgi:predicted outer membrane repeat protein